MSELPIIFEKALGGLKPVNQIAARALDSFKVGDKVRVRLSKPRIHKHAAKFWLLATKIAEAIGPEVTAEMIVSVIKIRTGHVQTVKTAHGIVQWPASIAFNKMSQDQFSALYERALVIISTDFLPGVKPSDIKSQIESLMA